MNPDVADRVKVSWMVEEERVHPLAWSGMA